MLEGGRADGPAIEPDGGAAVDEALSEPEGADAGEPPSSGFSFGSLWRAIGSGKSDSDELPTRELPSDFSPGEAPRTVDATAHGEVASGELADAGEAPSGDPASALPGTPLPPDGAAGELVAASSISPLLPLEPPAASGSDDFAPRGPGSIAGASDPAPQAEGPDERAPRDDAPAAEAVAPPEAPAEESDARDLRSTALAAGAASASARAKKSALRALGSADTASGEPSPEAAEEVLVAPEASVRLKLYSEQIRIGPDRAGVDTVETYRRIIKRFAHPAGLERGAELAVDFAPGHQSLTFHGVWREREGKRVAVFDPEQVKVIQQERAPEERLAEGTLSAIFFVPDVRVGDTIEYAYTLTGTNPLFGARYFGELHAALQVPIDDWHVRVVIPSSRTLDTRPQGTDLEPRITEAQGVREYVWNRRGIAPIQLDDSLPGWFLPYPRIQLSEFTSWSDVVAWALPLYTLEAKSDGLVAKKVKALEKFGTRQEQFLQALRFVQDEIRYSGVEFGPHAHRPQSAHETLERRVGDGKDKALLLVTLLRALGIEAHPALVHTRAQHRIERWLPSPAAFDHVIVRGQLENTAYWVDPTATLERGGLEQLLMPAYGRALVIDPAETTLTELPVRDSEAPQVDIEESWAAADRAKPVKLTVTIRHRGAAANQLRRQIAAQPRSEFAREYLNYYARTDPKIRVSRPLEVRDDLAQNELTLVAEYAIEDFWRSGRRDLYGSEVARYLTRPRITQRTMPLGIEHPVHLRHMIRLDPPDALEVDNESGTLESEVARLDYNFRAAGRTVLLEFHYRTFTDAVWPPEIPAYLHLLDRMNDRLSYWVRIDSGRASVAAPSKDRGKITFFLPVFLFVLLVLFAVASGAFRARQQPLLEEVPADRRALLRFDPAPGETAATALVAATIEDQQRQLQQLRCSCGARGPGRDTAPLEIPLVLAGRHIVAVKWSCPTCATPRTAYFTRQSDEDEQAESA